MKTVYNTITSKTEVMLNNKYLRLAIYEVFNGKCFYTGRSISFAKMHIDHIIAKSKGGENNIENYVLCCQDINLIKNGHFLYPELINVSKETNIALFSPKVVSVYNDLILNENILVEGYLELNFFLHKHNLQNDCNFRQKCYKKLISIKQKKEGQSRNRLFYKETDLKKLLNNHRSKSGKLPAMVGVMTQKYKVTGLVP